MICAVVPTALPGPSGFQLLIIFTRMARPVHIYTTSIHICAHIGRDGRDGRDSRVIHASSGVPTYSVPGGDSKDS